MINTIQTAEPLPRALTKLCLVMTPAGQVIFRKGHQVLKPIRKQEKQTNKSSIVSITVIKVELFQKDKIW